ncbi:MAG: hypothetical protein ACE5OZ_02575 [Candidatus Heimdallarchaeota archaeon]
MEQISLDACALIYLGKASLLEQILKTVSKVVIDQEVFEEVVVQGKAGGYADAQAIEATLQNYKIPIIVVNVQQELPFFRDKGETSTFLLSIENRVCVTSDRRAFTKFESRGAEVLRTDTLLFKLLLSQKINYKIAASGLEALLKVGGTTPERFLVISRAMEEMIQIEE